MEEKLISHLKDLGYTFDPVMDATLLEYCLDSVENKIKIKINSNEIPEALEHVEIDMTCGEFLMMKKSMGQLDPITTQSVIETIKEGDTSITYKNDGVMSPEKLFMDCINNMINGHDVEFIRYRKMVW